MVRADPNAYIAFIGTEADGTEVGSVDGAALDFAAIDPTTRVLEGRVPEGSDPSQILVNAGFAERLGAQVGEKVALRTYGAEQYDAVGAGEYSEPTGPTYEFTIAGIIRVPFEIVSAEPSSPGENSRFASYYVIVPDTWYWAHHTEYLDFGAAYSVQLDKGSTTVKDFKAAVAARLPPDAELGFGRPDLAEGAARSLTSPVGLETTSLLVLGIGVALSGTAAVALLLRAEQRDRDRDAPALRALGSTRLEISLIAGVRTLPVAAAASALAAAVAIALSGRYPIGIGRELELDPGMSLHLTVVGLGAILVALVVGGAALLWGRPPVERTRSTPTPDTASRWLARVGAPRSAVLGTHFAFARRDGRSATGRAAIAGGAAALAIVTATAVFVGGVDRLYSDPGRHGFPWDAVVGNTNFSMASDTTERLASDPRVQGMTVALIGEAAINDAGASVFVIDPSGTAPPTVTRGRLPSTASEIAIGPALRTKLGVDVGDPVTLSIAAGDLDSSEGGPRDVALTVVGVAALPTLNDQELGEDAVITFDALSAAGGTVDPQLAMVQLRSGDPAADLASLDRDLTEDILNDWIPSPIVNLHKVRGLPLLGLLLAAVLGTTVLAFTLAALVRARLRDLAVLRVLGMEARRLRRILAWQGLALGGAMLAIGLPIGLAVGAAWWRSVAGDLGASSSAVVNPPLWLLLPMTGLVAIGASLYPAWRARRRTAAELLRTE